MSRGGEAGDLQRWGESFLTTVFSLPWPSSPSSRSRKDHHTVHFYIALPVCHTLLTPSARIGYFVDRAVMHGCSLSLLCSFDLYCHIMPTMDIRRCLIRQLLGIFVQRNPCGFVRHGVQSSCQATTDKLVRRISNRTLPTASVTTKICSPATHLAGVIHTDMPLWCAHDANELALGAHGTAGNTCAQGYVLHTSPYPRDTHPSHRAGVRACVAGVRHRHPGSRHK